MRVSNVLYEADEPVDEPTAHALAANEVLREPLSNYLDQIRRQLRNVFLAGGAVTLLGIFAGLLGSGLLQSFGLIILGLGIAGGGYWYITSQSPDITLQSMEKGYWTAHCVPGQDGTFVYDSSGSLESKTFQLERLENQDRVKAANDQLLEAQDFPVVMSREENIEQTIQNTLEDVRSQIETAQQETVEAPLIKASSMEAEAIGTLAQYAEHDTANINADITESKAESDIEELDELERMAAAKDAEADLETLSSTSRQLVSDLSGLQETAVDLLNDHIGTAADAFGLVSYNFYCPTCMDDDIESVVEFSDPQDGAWYCATCRETHAMSAVIPRHRIKDNLVDPIWDQLWIEKDDQRREIYENIEDEKSELQEREFEQQQEEIRTSTDRIRDLRADIRDLQTQAKASEGKVSEIGDLMVKYEHINRNKKQEFEQDVEASFAEIDEKTEQILEETRNEEQQRIEAAQQASKEKAQLMREEERRKERAKLQAQFEHEEKLHNEDQAREAREHRENWMLKTRGRTSILGTIDKAKMKRDRMLRQSTNNGGD